MTAQIGDSYQYEGTDYKIVAMSSPMPFRPEAYGITPVAACTACWDGYWCEYSITEDGIFLKNFYVNSKDDNYPPLNGVEVSASEPRKSARFLGHHLYKDVNLPIHFTGRIVAGAEFIREYYIHMGYQRAWAYETLKEFEFEAGKLISVIDHSGMAAKLRADIQENPKEFDLKLHGNARRFVEESFSLGMTEKCWWLD